VRHRHRIRVATTVGLLAAAVCVAGGDFGAVSAAESDAAIPPDSVSGAEAISTLGDRLAAVAADIGWTPSELRHELLADESLRVSPSSDSLYYVDSVAPGATATDAAQGSSAGGPAAIGLPPLADTFILHSRPGAARTVYLDVDGHTTVGTDWNAICDDVLCPEGAPIVSEALDVDGNTGSFSNAELGLIQGIWARAADDYAMFDIDVTTESPPLSDIIRSSFNDERYGLRVVVTRSNFYNPALGVAFVGAFGDLVDTPAFVFTRINNQPYTLPYGLAHGVSHEIGHTLGLHHDGSTNPAAAYSFGSSGWGPIMGGAGIAQYVTWSKGEYAFANNGEGDLAVMATFGATPLADVIGDTPAASHLLFVAGVAFAASGRIETAADTDVYAVDIGGHLEVTAAPSAPLEPNLDLRLRLLDATGTVIATSNPPNRGAPALSVDVAEGRYYLAVDGIGQGNPLVAGGYSDYASLGTFELAGTTTQPGPGPGLPPVAVGSATPNGAPLTIAFSSAGSYDPEGGALTYFWQFGDGYTSPDANPTRTYIAPGTYGATLTVTDTAGQPTSTPVVVVLTNPAKQLKVSTITGLRLRKGTVKVTVTVLDGFGSPVRSAVVRGKWAGSSVTRVGYTNSKGVATFIRYTSKPATFTTTRVSRTARVWDGVNVTAAVPASP